MRRGELYLPRPTAERAVIRGRFTKLERGLGGIAVQRAGREDETLILIPDEESELHRRKTLEMFGRPPAGSLQS